jgi:hypothetical protein
MRRLILVMACVAVAACSRTADPMDASVASWNGVHVTLGHFIQEYELYGTYAPVTDDLPTRVDYAKLMLERMVIAEGARQAGMDTSRIVRETIRRRTEMASRAHLFRIKVQPAVKPATEAEIREAFRRANTRVFTQQIYAPTKAAADSLHALLAQGADFDALARQSTGGTGIMGWVTFDMLDEGPEAVLLAMSYGSISEPLESLRGWHIFRALEVEETVNFDEGTYQNNRERLRFKVDQRRFDEASARWQRAQVEPISLATDVRLLREFHRQLAPILPQRDVPEDIARYNREVQFLKPELSPDTPLAMVDGKPFTVAQFLYQLPDIPYHWVRSNPIEALQVAIRDSILADVARRTVRPDTARAVRLAERVAEYSSLYYAALQREVDRTGEIRLAEAHLSLLPLTFNRDDIRIDTTAIRNAL